MIHFIELSESIIDLEHMSTKVNSRYLLTDGTRIGILLYLRENEGSASHMLLKVNSNYHIVKDAIYEL